MVELVPIRVGDFTAIGISVHLPKTRVLVISTENGYIMYGLVDLARLDELHPERRIAAARVTHVRTIQDLLTGKVDAVTDEARRRGVVEGMTGFAALEKLA